MEPKERDIILYERFGYQVKMLELHHGTEVFNMLAETTLSRTSRTTSMYSQDRNKLKKETLYAITEPKYNSVGLFNNNELIGVSYTSIEQAGNPWLGLFYLRPQNRYCKPSLVLSNYIFNHLYDGITVQIGDTNSSFYKKGIRNTYRFLGCGIVENWFLYKLRRICDGTI